MFFFTFSTDSLISNGILESIIEISECQIMGKQFQWTQEGEKRERDSNQIASLTGYIAFNKQFNERYPNLVMNSTRISYSCLL